MNDQKSLTQEPKKPVQKAPITGQPVKKAPVQPKPVAVQPASVEKPGKTILLVEDDLPMVKMYSTKLKQENFVVEVAHDGEEALVKIKANLPGLVLLDLMIPKIGGMDLLEKLRADPKTKSLPVVILSNLSQEQDIQRASQLGVKIFLVKANFTPSQVVKEIKKHLG